MTAQGIEAAPADKTRSGLAEGESPFANGDAPNSLAQKDISMTDTTEQQAVTVAHDITRNPAVIWLSPICDDTAHHGEGRTWAAPSPDETCEDCGEPWVKYVRVDLASVSSASADYVLVPRVPTAAMWEAAERVMVSLATTPGADKDASQYWSAMLAASPEPVPATNQAGEVERAILEAWLTDVQRAAVKGAIHVAGDWMLTTEYENDPEIIEGLPELIADPVSGILTPLGEMIRAALIWSR